MTQHELVRGWRYFWRRFLGWMPLQFCVICGRPYWGGPPEFAWFDRRPCIMWLPCWKDYCSAACSDADDGDAWLWRARREYLKNEPSEEV